MCIYRLYTSVQQLHDWIGICLTERLVLVLLDMLAVVGFVENILRRACHTSFKKEYTRREKKSQF